MNIHKFSVAPMLGLTDKHCHYFYSLLNSNIKLYTGMIHTSLFLLKYKNRMLYYNFIKNNIVAIQFISNNPKELYICSKIAERLNFSEINFNIGCPSLNCNKNNLGFYLYNNINKIIDCLNSIKYASEKIILSLKLRINISYSYKKILDFIYRIYSKTKCKIFIIHARSIVKNNFSTKINLNNPKLNYNIIYKIKKELPNLIIIINGNINSIKDIDNHLKYVDGVMIGRYIYKNPLFLLDLDYKYNKKNYNFYENTFFNCNKKINFKIRKVLFYLYKYIKKEIYINNTNPINIIKHICNIFYNLNNSCKLRNNLIKSSYIFKKFNNYINFENFIINDVN